MTTASHKTLQVLEQIEKVIPVGTNLALLQLMRAMISGVFLSSRGAVHSALARCGFEADEIRHSWRALRWGQWSSAELPQRFRQQVAQTGQWQSRERRWQRSHHVASIDTVNSMYMYIACDQPRVITKAYKRRCRPKWSIVPKLAQSTCAC